MQRAVRRDDLTPRSIGWIAPEVAELSSGLFDQEETGRDIPGMKFEFPIPIESSGGDITKIERRAAVSADAPGRFDDISKTVEIVVVALMDVVGESGGNQGASELGFPGDVKTSVSKPCAFAEDGLEAFVEKRVVDDRDRPNAFDFDSDRDAEAREAVCEIGCSIEWINDPAHRGARPVVAMALFGEDGIAAAGGLDAIDDQGFAGAVDLRDEVDRGTFGVDAQPCFVPLALLGAGAFGELPGQCEQGRQARIFG